MLVKRNQLYKRRIIGGSLLGNVIDKAKGVLTSATKAIASKLPSAKNVLKSSASKVLSKGKELAGTLLNKGKAIAVEKGKELARKAFDKGK